MTVAHADGMFNVERLSIERRSITGRRVLRRLTVFRRVGSLARLEILAAGNLIQERKGAAVD
jgi:hypothetical protein